MMQWLDILWWQALLLFATGIVAGFVDSIAGGGGLLTLPVLLSICPDPRVALGTNKLQAMFGSTSATFHFARVGALDLRDVFRACLLAFLGALLGTFLVTRFNPELLKKLLPFLLLAVVVFIWLRPQIGEKDIHPRVSRMKFDFIFEFGIGFYDGLIGPGTGTFLALAFMLGLGFNLARATAHAKALNCASNLASLIVFLFAQKIWFVAGLLMGAGQGMGAWLGSHMVVTRGTKFIRPIFLTMTTLVTVKLIWDNWIKAAH
jgi:uncharacterized membrane protein YfcA